MSEYVPTTEDVRRQYRAPAVSVDLTDPQRKGENFADYLSRVAGVDAFRHQQASYLAFDRWLAEYTREKQAEAWEQGNDAFEQAWESDNRFPHDYATDNPYRKEKNNE